MRVIVDIHEPFEIYEGLIRRGIPVERRKISPGDVVVGDIGIERKTIYDFFNSLIRKRLFEQISRLSDAYQKAILVLEGDLGDIYSYRNYRAFLGAMISTVVDFNVPILYSRDLHETIHIINSIWNTVIKEKRAVIIRYKPKFMDEEEMKLYIIQGLPNIGPKLAERLLMRFRTVRGVFTSTLADLKDVEGIGDKKARDIMRIITEPYKSASSDEG